MICSLSEDPLGGNMMPSGLCFRYALISAVSASLRLAFSTPATPSYGKGLKDNGPVCSFRVCHKVFRQRETKAHTFLTHHLHTRPGKGNDWGHITPSACPLVLVTITSNIHKGTLFSLVFSSKPFLGVTHYLY